MAQTLDYIEKTTSEPATMSVVWLHGLGADCYDFHDIVPLLELPKTLGVRFLFPNAPVMAVTCNGGMRMRAWYDIVRIGPSYKDDIEGIQRSAEALAKLVEHEMQRGIPSDRIVLAGFSQGGAVSLFTGLRYPRPLAGIIALSTYLPATERLQQDAHPANKKIPILMMHGLHDAIVPIAFAKQSLHLLLSLEYKVLWRDFPMPHSVCAEQLREIGKWLAALCVSSSAISQGELI